MFNIPISILAPTRRNVVSNPTRNPREEYAGLKYRERMPS